jgi:CheY-like chemotaxis protein
VPIIAITASMEPEVARIARAAGAFDVVAKPFELGALAGLVAAAMKVALRTGTPLPLSRTLTLTAARATPTLPSMSLAPFIVRIAPYFVVSAGLAVFAVLLSWIWALKNEAYESPYECSGCGAPLTPEAPLCRACGRARW